MQVTTVDEKTMASAEHVDNKFQPSVLEAEKGIENNEHLDRFGAWAKSDPLEIALVRKLDIYMMVCSCLC
jgi:hypothetical protein